MSLKNFKISANGNIAAEGGTIKFTGTILIVNEGTTTDEEINMKALKIEDDVNVSQEGLVEESPTKSVNLLEESEEENTDTDDEDAGTDTDNDEVGVMPGMSTAAGGGSKILFHQDSDVDDDYELSQTISGYGY